MRQRPFAIFLILVLFCIPAYFMNGELFVEMFSPQGTVKSVRQVWWGLSPS